MRSSFVCEQKSVQEKKRKGAEILSNPRHFVLKTDLILYALASHFTSNLLRSRPKPEYYWLDFRNPKVQTV